MKEIKVNISDDQYESIKETIVNEIVNDIVQGDLTIFEKIKEYVRNNMKYTMIGETEFTKRLLIMIYWEMEANGY